MKAIRNHIKLPLPPPDRGVIPIKNIPRADAIQLRAVTQFYIDNFVNPNRAKTATPFNYLICHLYAPPADLLIEFLARPIE
jgi:hypothetical protein